VRALQKFASTTDRIASTWYNPGNFTVDINITDGQTHAVALYVLDWDRAGRTETIDVLDTNTGAVLSTQTASAFGGGQYLVWNVSGHVKFRVTDGAGSVNAVLAGLFFDPQASPPAPSGTATFVTTDGTTQGTWKNTYGATGYSIVNDATSLPAWAQLGTAGATPYTWAASTGDVRALQKAASSTDRIASTWYSGSNFVLDLNLTDGQTHRVALYALDWDGAGRTETIDVLDAGTGTVLDTRSVSSFGGGKYLVWNVSGHVKFRVTNGPGSLNAVLSGLFLG
jgi:hypothetical protein